ncbi:LytR family transcriptional regulator [Streptomyces sp. AJS327]|uniref:LytR C-terminal domain-containing protein n=1 Tax=Streptomyces sp. AJS327 TaxID=2545265 RepID=UPI0015DD7230|nr:LytR C-terminal domain-containing protein [Streptomyces sp. AJS327]MBA0052683.1 LytR family transcriptional regulator [Streptomyces sp. AJS327]
MSMLTPPGMGGKYRITGDRYPRMRRPKGQRRVVMASVAAVVALAAAGYGTLELVQVFSGDDSSTEAKRGGGASPCPSPSTGDGGSEGARTASGDAKPGAEPRAERLPKPGSITVNVLNATTRSGLAKDTADELKKRGFTIGEIGNAPAKLDKKVKGSALLLAAPGKRTTASLKVLGTQLTKPETSYEERDGREVDLVLGDDFTKLTGKKEADHTLSTLRRATPAPAASNC